MMKKFFAIFLALTVVPTFQTYAWIGGPFSNNSFTPGGDDGIYEAVAIPTSVNPAVVNPAVPGFNGVGLFRWGVFNNNPGLTGGVATFTPGGVGNVQFGGMTTVTNQHVWYINGMVLYGTCFGTVNSIIGTIQVVGGAQTLTPVATTVGVFLTPGGVIPGTPPIAAMTANSHFAAQIRNGNYFHAGRNFQGSGEVSVFTSALNAPVAPLTFIVFGSRVSHLVTG